uniref:Acyl-coenzyme A thioesterase 13 n=1 Tax=Ananas comosus var. bracteatus TaxID=296719 RepID=A0A6V7Q6Z5_ANACO|nr:unnamed protein product [Ananas comosus var. bracteatus]
MELDAVKRSLEAAAAETLPTPSLSSLPSRFYDAFVLRGLRVDAAERGRLLCSLSNTGNFLHGGATASLIDLVGSAAFYTAGATTRGAPLEMSISYLDAAYAHEEIEIEAKVLRAGKAVGVATVELRKKNGKQLIAQARYTSTLRHLVTCKGGRLICSILDFHVIYQIYVGVKLDIKYI